MKINAGAAKMFLRAAGMDPAMVDIILDVGGRIKKAGWGFKREAGLKIWRVSGITDRGKFDVTIRIEDGELADQVEKSFGGASETNRVLPVASGGDVAGATSEPT
jgi:hypothetical protein